MQLSWTHQDRIAKALMLTYPDADRINLSMEDLRHYVVALPGFGDKPYPPKPSYLEKILWTWMRLADASGGGD